MNKVLVVGPSTSRGARGGIATVISQMLESDILKDGFELEHYTSYNGMKSKLLTMLYGVSRIALFPFKVKNYDLIHINMTTKGSTLRKSFYIRVAKHYGKKVVVQIHCCDYFTDVYLSSSPKKRKYISSVLSSSDMILSLSDVWKNTLSEVVGLSNCRYLPNGVDVNKFLYNEDGEGILFIGSIKKDKGVYDLIKSLSFLKEEGMEPKCVIAGVGELKRLKEVIKENNLENVKAVGWVDGEEKVRVLSDASILVLPSYHEGFPTVILEGMASGCAIVATRVGAIGEMIEDTLVDVGDPESLKKELEVLLKEKDKVVNSVRYNYFKVQDNFSLDKVHEKLKGYYKELLEE